MKTVVIGISGGIAATKIPLLLQILKSHVNIIPIMTEAACRIIPKEKIETEANSHVYTDLFPKEYDTDYILKQKKIDHIEIAQKADLFVVVPATANTIASCAYGLANNFLTTSILATKAPVLFCPSMNTTMWNHPAVQKNLQTLQSYGYYLLQPDTGNLACGTEGIGRLPEPTIIASEIFRLLNRNLVLHGKKILITSGGTQEPIDDVRVITNKSSGTMGAALADECVVQGANVTYLHADNAQQPVNEVKKESFTSVNDLEHLLHKHLLYHDVLFHVAAVSDFTVKAAKTKLSSKTSHTITLQPQKKLYKDLKQQYPQLTVITFKANPETSEDLWKKNLQQALIDSESDCVLGNPINKKDQGFNSPANEIYGYSRKNIFFHFPTASKKTIAQEIISFLSNSQII